VIRFYELHNNKWFHIMNVSLEIIKTEDKKQKYMLMNYGKYFFELWPDQSNELHRIISK
jgi:hypothetical protein